MILENEKRKISRKNANEGKLPERNAFRCTSEQKALDAHVRFTMENQTQNSQVRRGFPEENDSIKLRVASISEAMKEKVSDSDNIVGYCLTVVTRCATLYYRNCEHTHIRIGERVRRNVGKLA